MAQFFWKGFVTNKYLRKNFITLLEYQVDSHKYAHSKKIEFSSYISNKVQENKC